MSPRAALRVGASPRSTRSRSRRRYSGLSSPDMFKPIFCITRRSSQKIYPLSRIPTNPQSRLVVHRRRRGGHLHTGRMDWYPAAMSLREEISRSRKRETLALLLLAGGVFLMLSVVSYDFGDIPLLRYPPHAHPHNLMGTVGAWCAFLLLMLFGIAGYLAPVAVFGTGLLLIFGHRRGQWHLPAWEMLLVVALACLVELQPELWAPVQEKVNLPSPGGLTGALLGRSVLIRYFGPLGAGATAATVALVAVVYLFDFAPSSIVHLILRAASTAGRLLLAAGRSLRPRASRKATSAGTTPRAVGSRPPRVRSPIRQAAIAAVKPPPTPPPSSDRKPGGRS
ncbi:MAG TPA: hypothetical protein EYP62_06210, partial [Kiritimatiellae bacterium]|nr:hypothetical protein [Kiritimatiellia bacterium]